MVLRRPARRSRTGPQTVWFWPKPCSSTTGVPPVPLSTANNPTRSPARTEPLPRSPGSIGEDDARVLPPMGEDQLEQGSRIFRMQADAAVRRRPPQVFGVFRPMDGVAAGEKDRVRHRRIVVLLRVPHLVQARRPERAAWGPIALASRRYRPPVLDPSVFRDRHRLRRDIDA